MKVDYDVLIIGSGPGGSSAAIQLTKLGHEVAILERDKFPRHHVGLCLSDSTFPLFELLELQQQIDNERFWERNTTAVCWGNSKTKFVQHRGLHVDRGRLDQLMLSKARELGASVYQVARVLRTSQNHQRIWHVEFDQAGTRKSLSARFVVDASGRRAILPGRRLFDSKPLIGIHAIWSIKHMPAFDGLIKSGRSSWLWFARTAADRGAISIFCDPKGINCSGKNGLQDNYGQLISQFELVREDRSWSQLTSVRGHEASSHHSDSPIGMAHIRVGDACLSVDPLSSQGVHLALLTGIQGAIAANTIIKKPENARLATNFYEARTIDRVTKYTRKTKLEYAKVCASNGGEFWKLRSGALAIAQPEPIPVSRPNTSRLMVSVSEKTSLQKAPAIVGDFVETRSVIGHPAIGRVAFVDGIDVVPLIAKLQSKTIPFESIPKLWKDYLPMDKSRKVASWLLSNGVLERGVVPYESVR